MRLIKLVRDRIPKVVPNAVVVYRKLTPLERKKMLRNKLFEEALEYRDNPSVEELADVLEVVRALAVHDLGVGFDAIADAALKKRKDRGALLDGVGMFIAETNEPAVLGQTAEQVIAFLESELDKYNHLDPAPSRSRS